MSWIAVTKKDFQDSVRSWWIWGLSAVFITFFFTSAYIFTGDALGILEAVLGGAIVEIENPGQVTSDEFFGLLVEVTALLIPIIAITSAYASVSGERESGTLKLLLSLPHSRLDMLVGKTVGRTGVVILPLLAGFVLAAIPFLATEVEFKPETYFGFALLTAVLGAVFVALSVGFSAGSRTNRQSIIGTVGLYVLFTLFWNRFANNLVSLLNDQTDLETATLIESHVLIKMINPTQAYKSLVFGLTTDSAVSARVGLFSGFTQQAYAQELGDSVPAYLSDPAVGAILLAWVVIPLALGYLVFREADL